MDKLGELMLSPSDLIDLSPWYLTLPIGLQEKSRIVKWPELKGSHSNRTSTPGMAR